MFSRTPTQAQSRPSQDEPGGTITPSDPNTLRFDPLAASLTYLAAHHGRAVSREALLGGLPILDGRLSVALYDRAARRAGLETEAIKRDIADIPAIVLPAVLIMKTGAALILLGIDAANQSVKVLDPTIQPGAPQVLSIKAVSADYTGYTFLVRAAAEANARAVAAGDLPRNHWFWSVVKVHWRSYGHIALAALLINMLALAMPLFTMSVYDRVIPNGAIPSLIALSIGMGIAVVFDFVLRAVRSRMIDVTGKTMDVVLAANIFEHVMAVKMAQRPVSVGILANQLRDFDSVREFFTSGSIVSATDLLFAMLFLAVLFTIAGPLAWIPLVMLPTMIAIGFIMQRPLDRAMKRLQAESAARHGVLVESLSGLETVRATGCRSPHADSLGTLRCSHGAIGRGRALLVFADIDQRQLGSTNNEPVDGHHRRISHSGREALGGRPCRRQHAGGPRSGSYRRHCLDHHARYPNPVVAQVDQSHHVAGAGTVTRARLRYPKDQ